MRAEQNELITRIGPGTACGDLMRSYWQPAALVDEFDPRLDPRMARAAGEGGAPARPGPGAVSRRRESLGPDRPRLPASRRRPLLRPARGRRPALPVPRLEVRRRRALPRDAGRAARARRCAPGSASAAIRCRCARASSSPGSAPRARRRRPCRRSTLRRAGEPQLRLQGPLALQLAAGLRGRHRSGASVVPAPLPRGRVARSKPPTAGSSAPPAPARSAASAGR